MTSKATAHPQDIHWIDGPKAHKIILTIILINAIAVGLTTVPLMNEKFSSLLTLIEDFTIFLFIIEIGIRLWVQRGTFFREGWNLFDIIVVGLSIIPHEAGFSILRSFRILKSLSVMETNPHLSHIVNVLLKIWPKIFMALLLLGLSFYVLGVMGVELFGEAFPDEFGDLGYAMLTLFALMQSDNYGEITLNVMKVYPWAWVYFVAVTVILAFVMMNLFVGIVVDAMQSFVEEATSEEVEETEALEEAQDTQLAALSKDVQDIKKVLKQLSTKLK